MGVRHTLLDTPPERVPHDLAQLVIDFCKPIEAVVAGYVGLTEVAEDFRNPVERLAVAFELDCDDDERLRLVADRFYDSMPDEVQAGGCNVLAPAAVGIWREKAQRVYTRA